MWHVNNGMVLGLTFDSVNWLCSIALVCMLHTIHNRKIFKKGKQNCDGKSMCKWP